MATKTQAGIHPLSQLAVFANFGGSCLWVGCDGMDAILDDVYMDAGSSEVMSKSYSTRITEVADADEPTEHELPVGNDHGYAWR